MIQSKWKKLLYMQKAERIGLIMEQIVQGYTMAEAARVLGMHRQQLYRFCKENDLKFIKPVKEPTK